LPLASSTSRTPEASTRGATGASGGFDDSDRPTDAAVDCAIESTPRLFVGALATVRSSASGRCAGVRAGSAGFVADRDRFGCGNGTGGRWGAGALVDDTVPDDAMLVEAVFGEFGATLTSDTGGFVAEAFSRLRATSPATRPAATTIAAPPTKRSGGQDFFLASGYGKTLSTNGLAGRAVARPLRSRCASFSASLMRLMGSSSASRRALEPA
jgi:hypothetical protein